MAHSSEGGSPRPDQSDFDGLLTGFGAKLRAGRLKLGLTQAQLAERSGRAQQYVSLVETGKQNVTLTTALTFATVIGWDLSSMVSHAKSRSRDTEV